MTTFVERHFWKLLACVWLLEAALLLFVARDAIMHWKVVDPDDHLRIVQVRDWLAGQSWSDVSQHRMNPPSGGDMHWSRLVDVPLGLAMISLTPLVGHVKAELWAAVVIPMFTFGIFLCCYARLVRTHFGSIAAIASTAGLLTAVPLMVQLVPLRVDHHGWQLVCMTLCMTFLLDQKRPVRSAIMLGIVSAVWLEISIEAFPFVVAFIGIMGLRWLFGTLPEGQRPLTSPFNIMVASTAIASTLLLLVMKPLTSLNQAPCDALSSAHVAAFLGCAVALTVMLAALHFSGRKPSLWLKAVIVSLAAIVALAVLSVGAPQCVGDNFQSLDPIVKLYWFDRVAEGLPIFHLNLEQIIIASVILLLGLLGIFYLLRSSEVSRETKTALVLTFAATALVGTYVSRTLVYFIIIVSFIVAPLSVGLFARISEQASLQRRLIMRTAAIALLLPVLTGQLVSDSLGLMKTVLATKPPARFPIDYAAAKSCQATSSIKKLGRLPTSNLLVGLDVAPAVLQHTAHRVVASGHHRNELAMRDVINAFISTPDVLASVLKARKIDYVVVCAGAPEFVLYRVTNPQGNWARLNDGEQFGVLVEQEPLGPFRIWQVQK